jgi:hypothetical protein
LCVGGSLRNEAMSSPPRAGVASDGGAAATLDGPPLDARLARNTAAPAATTIANTANEMNNFRANDDLTGQLIG